MHEGPITIEEQSRRPLGLGDLVYSLVRIPILGKAAVILLFGPFIVIPVMLFFAPPFREEVETSGKILEIWGTETLKRKVEYEFHLGKERFTGTMQWVDTRQRPNIRAGATIKVYYHPDNPSFSRAEGDPSHTQQFFMILGVCIGGWLLLIAIAYIRARWGGVRLPLTEAPKPFVR